MNTFKLLCCLSLLLSVTVSCQEDEYIGPEQVLITLKANHVYAGCGLPSKIVVADARGRILAVSDAMSCNDLPITGPVADGDHSVNVFIVGATDQLYHVAAYYGIRKGSEFSGVVDQAAWEPSYETSLALTDIPAFDHLVVSTDISSYAFSKEVDASPRRMSYQANNIFAQITSGGEGRYGFMKADESGLVRFDQDMITSPSAKKPIALHNFSNGGHISVTGSISEHGPISDRFIILDNVAPFDPEVYYPASAFSRYLTEFTYGNNDRIYYYKKSGPEPDFDFEPVTFDGKVFNDDPENFEMQISGRFDYYRASFETGSNKTSLTVYGRACNTTFRLPDFSRVKGLGPFPFADLRSYNIQIWDNDDLEENHPYFNRFSTGIVDAEQDYNSRMVSFGDWIHR